jgi:superfamily II DNA or RNA helicase
MFVFKILDYKKGMYDLDNQSVTQQIKIRTYYDKESTLTKRPYHFYATKHRPILQEKHPNESKQEISRRIRAKWKKLPYQTYTKYIYQALRASQTILTNNGYELYTPNYDDAFLDKIRHDLMVKPVVVKGYGKPPEEYPVYQESGKTLTIPRYYGNKVLSKKEQNAIPNMISRGMNINVTFNPERQLRPYQLPVMESFKKLFDTVGGGILQAGCGLGKTTQALYMIYMLQKKTLVLIHKENLLLQWIERATEFIPGARIGIIQGKKIDVEDKDIVIGMIQSVCKKDYGDLFKQFGLLIVDEAHRTGAKEFCKALKNSATYNTLGLTATPTRQDGLTKVFKWYLGEIGHVLKRAGDEYKVTARAIYYSSDQYVEKKLYSGGFNFANMLGQIVDQEPRNVMIVEMARKMVLEEGRNVLMIGHRRKHLTNLNEMILAKNTDDEHVSVGFFVGGMKKEELEESTTKNIIIGTYSMIEEGADIPKLDTVIMLTPKSTVEQTVGRIMRQKNKNDPLIIDIIDEFSAFTNQSEKRKKFYKKQSYLLEGYKNGNGMKTVKMVDISECVF